MPTKRTQEEFIELAKNKFGDKFSYDNVVYVNNTTPVEIFCNIHKRVFYSTPKHLLRMSLDSGCEECRKEILVNTGKHLKGRKYPNRNALSIIFNINIYTNLKIFQLFYFVFHQKLFLQFYQHL